MLAREHGNGPVLAASIAARERVPRKFLDQILLELSRRGIVQSRRGRGGGYQLGRPASEISMGEIVRLLDGPLAPVPCVSHTAYRRCEECADEAACGVRLAMGRVRDAVAEILDGTTLAQFAPPPGRETGRRRRRAATRRPVTPRR